MQFHFITIRASGELARRRLIDSDDSRLKLAQNLAIHLEAKWGDKGWLYLPLPESFGPIGLAWRRLGWAAVTRFEVQGYVASSLALLSGVDCDDDELSRSMLQTIVTVLLRAAGREPAFELLTIEERPAAVRVAWQN